MDHNSPCLPPKILHNHCLRFLLGTTVLETMVIQSFVFFLGGGGGRRGGGGNKVHYGLRKWWIEMTMSLTFEWKKRHFHVKMDKKTDLYGEKLSLVEGSSSQPSQLIKASVYMRKNFTLSRNPEPPGLICNDHVTTRNSARACLVLTELILLGEPNCVQKRWPRLG